MKKHIVILSLGLFALGCGASQPEKKAVLARVNNYEITAQEFQQEFKDSPYAALGTPTAKKDFLESLINRKLILQEAQASGLDKDQAFLRLIERFWEQSLLKTYLDQKMPQIHAQAQAAVNEGMIQEAYNKLVHEGKTDKSYAEMQDQIKWVLIKAKESTLLNEWLVQLRQRADIKVNLEGQGGLK
ncbi:MAG: SurA N-terminal domain-containing protein [Candidatus Omnitrophota bacterium]